ncbi:MAG: hypothetical protein ACLR8B_03300 [Peptoniphilus harei]
MKEFKITNKRLLTENIYLMDVEAPSVAKSLIQTICTVKIDEKGKDPINYLQIMMPIKGQ